MSIWLFANTNVYCSKAHSISPVIDDDNNDDDDGPAGHGGLFGKLKIHPYARSRLLRTPNMAAGRGRKEPLPLRTHSVEQHQYLSTHRVSVPAERVTLVYIDI